MFVGRQSTCKCFHFHEVGATFPCDEHSPAIQLEVLMHLTTRPSDRSNLALIRMLVENPKFTQCLAYITHTLLTIIM